MPTLARFTTFYDFLDFQKAVATLFLGISKIPTLNFEIHYFSYYLFKNFNFPDRYILYHEKINSGYKLKYFTAMPVYEKGKCCHRFSSIIWK